MVRGRELGVLARVQKLGRIGILLLDAEQDVERCGAGGREWTWIFWKSSVVQLNQFPVAQLDPASRRCAVDSRGRSRPPAFASCLRFALRAIAARFRATTDDQAAALRPRVQPSANVRSDWLRCPDVEILPAKAGVRARPGLEAAQAVQDFLGGEMEINLAIFFFQDGRQRCLGIDPAAAA